MRHSPLRIQGSIKGKPIHVLVDSGSTHSFIVLRWAKDGVELLHTKPLSIIVANEEKLYSIVKCQQLEWLMQSHTFIHDLRVLPMGGSDMVLELSG